jgi:hypothetical protein
LYAQQKRDAQAQYNTGIKQANQNINDQELSRGLARSSVPITLTSDNQATMQGALQNTLGQYGVANTAAVGNANSQYSNSMASIMAQYAQMAAAAAAARRGSGGGGGSGYNLSLAQQLANALKQRDAQEASAQAVKQADSNNSWKNWVYGGSSGGYSNASNISSKKAKYKAPAANDTNMNWALYGHS